MSHLVGFTREAAWPIACKALRSGNFYLSRVCSGSNFDRQARADHALLGSMLADPGVFFFKKKGDCLLIKT